MKITTVLEIIHNQNMFDGIKQQIYLITCQCTTTTAKMEIKLSYATKIIEEQSSLWS
jgi:hypothetical protein